MDNNYLEGSKSLQMVSKSCHLINSARNMYLTLQSCWTRYPYYQSLSKVDNNYLGDSKLTFFFSPWHLSRTKYSLRKKKLFKKNHFLMFEWSWKKNLWNLNIWKILEKWRKYEEMSQTLLPATSLLHNVVYFSLSKVIHLNIGAFF